MTSTRRIQPAPHFDVVIVGTGMAGLSSALRLRALAPQASFCLVEQHHAPWVGGRTSNDTFHGVEIVTGAGIGRLRKDRLLHALVTRTCRLPSHTYEIRPHLAPTFAPVDVVATLRLLRRAFREEHARRHLTFKAFAKPLLGPDVYQRFLLSAGYTDFEEEDAEETLYYYGLEDNACCWTAFTVPWKRMVHCLVDRIGRDHFYFGVKVVGLEEIPGGGYQVLVEKKTQKKVKEKTKKPEKQEEEEEAALFATCDKVIVATTIVSLRQLFPHHPIYRQIEGQPFLRLYGQFAARSIPIMRRHVPRFTFVPGPLQRLIPMNPDKGVYMIAYCDNQNALLLQPFLANTAANRRLFCELLARCLGIDARDLHLLDIRDYFWKTGTHFYRPLRGDNTYPNRAAFVRAAQHPAPNILVVGEVVSRNQGWTEGALESVDKGLTKTWLSSLRH